MSKRPRPVADDAATPEPVSITCAYCYAPWILEEPVPAVDNDGEWRRLERMHRNGCTWAITRAHRINLDGSGVPPESGLGCEVSIELGRYIPPFFVRDHVGPGGVWDIERRYTNRVVAQVTSENYAVEITELMNANDLAHTSSSCGPVGGKANRYMVAEYCGDVLSPEEIRRRRMAMALRDVRVDLAGGRGYRGITSADAGLVARAVRSHDVLVRALKMLTSIRQDLFEGACLDAGMSREDTVLHLLDAISECRAAATTALALCERPAGGAI
jgi:hypothetical protein